MTLRGGWRISELPDYEADFADMMGPAYILFGPTSGEFAFGCVTGTIHGGAESEAVVFTWAMTKWTRPAAPDQPNSSPMDRCTAK